MKKIETIGSIKRLDETSDPFGSDNWVFFLKDEERVTAEIVEQWVKSENAQEVMLAVRITSPHQQKTNEQLGYYFVEVLPKITCGFQMYGNEYDINIVDELLKRKFLSDKIYDPIEDTWELIPKSKAKISKEEMSDLIDQCIRFASEYFPEVTIEDPEDYKRRKGITNDEWEQGYRNLNQE